jgi:hypothetical protein
VELIHHESVRHALRQAWDESSPGSYEAHEEGGFLLRSADGSIVIERWPVGLKKRIFVPEHPGGRRYGLVIVATFHTHPNPNRAYIQEPSRNDVLAVRNDPELSHPEYEGELVIATEFTYLIRRTGQVETIGRTGELLGI